MTATAPTLPQLGLTLFSLTLEMRRPGYTLEGMIDKAAELDLGPGIELVGFQSIRNWPNISDDFVRRFRDRLERHGFVPTAMSCNLDLALRRDRMMTEEAGLEYLEAQMVAARRLGFPIAKSKLVLTPSFVRGAAVACERHDMKLGFEIHSPEAVDHPNVMFLREMFEDMDSPYLGFVPDFSSSMRQIPPTLISAHEESGMPPELTEFAADVWRSDTSMEEKFARFAEEAPKLGATPADMGKLNMVLTMHGRMDPRRWAEVMDRVHHVHGKFYELDANGADASIDHEAIVDVLIDAGYTGYISSEWEGHAYTDHVSGWDMVRGHHDLLARLIATRARV
jgi:sugar phosphate isomerase/epimerase